MAKLIADKGAPAVAGRLESHEQAAEQKVNALNGQIEAIRELIQPNSSDEERKSLNVQLSELERQLIVAYKLWFELTAQVRDYYKAVDSSKREGEKILRAEVESLLVQSWRFQRMGRESFIISIAQDAIHCKDEQDFYARYAEQIRECEINALRNGVDHEKFASWCLDCYEKSL